MRIVPGRARLLSCLLVALSLACSPARERSGDASRITILSPGDERTIFAGLQYQAQFLLFLPLVTYDDRGEIVGRLARRWEHTRDYREWTFYLRTDVRWHDGVPVTAHDVKFTRDLFEKIWPHPQPRTTIVLDDSTVVFRHTRPTDALDWWEVFYPRHLLEGLDPKKLWRWDFWTRPVGNGPYRYVRHVPKTMVELEANPDYYGGKPRIERVVLKFASAAPVTELLSGAVDVATVSGADLPKLEADRRFRRYDHRFPIVDWLYALFWNHRDPLFRDPAVRRALTLAVDRRELHRLLNLPANLPVFDVVFASRQYWRGEVPEPLPYDPERAERLLEQSGWRDVDGDGVRERDGREFSFVMLAPAAGPTVAGAPQVAVFVQAQLRRVGVRLEVRALEFLALRQRLRSGDFQAAFSRLQIASIVGAEGIKEVFGKDGWIGYGDLRVVALLDTVVTAVDPDEQDRVFRELWTIFAADIPLTFLYPSSSLLVAHRRIRGLRSPFRADPVTHMEELWLEEEPR